MKNFMFVALATGLLAGCEVDAPSGDDRTAPLIRVSLSGGARIVLNASDAPREAPQNCIIVGDDPVHVQVLFSDAGGMRMASVSAGFGRIEPTSLLLAPTAPDVTARIETRPGRESVIVVFTPPAPGRVRTGALVEFDLIGAAGTVISADATDLAGNLGALAQFDLRSSNEGVACIGS